MECYISDSCKKANCCDMNNTGLCQRLFRFNALLNNGLLTERQKIGCNLTLSGNDIDREKYEQLKEIKESIFSRVKNGENFYIYSTTTGNGKTEWSLKLLREYVRHIWAEAAADECRVLFISVPKFLISLKENISHKSEYVEAIRASVYSADLVVWDDIGSKCGTEFEIENMLSIINARLESCNLDNIYKSKSGAKISVIAYGTAITYAK